MKKSKRSLVDKENFLIQNILKNSREGSRPKLKSIKADSLDIRTGRANSNRYHETENTSEGDTIQLPTFGDWKSQIKFCQPNRKLNSIEVPTKSLQTEQQQRSIHRIKAYQETKLRELAETKVHKFQPLHPIDNTLFFKEKENEQRHPRYRRKSIQESLSSKARALSRELQTNFETIDANLNRIVNRREIFKSLYLRQKEKYEDILRKYKIEDKVDDEQFQNYFRS